MLIYATYALYRKGYLFQRLCLPKSLRPPDLFVLLARVMGPQEGGPQEGGPQEGAVQPSPAVCLRTRCIRQC